MPPQPGLNPRVFVRAVVVDDEMQHEMGCRLGIDFLQEPDEFLVPMPRHAVADDFPIEQAQRRKQGRRPMAFVVVRHRPTAAFLQRQAWLRAIEGLDLAFLVDAQDQTLVRGIEVEADDIVELLDKLFVPADLESLDQMGFEPVLMPNPLNAHRTHALGQGHTAYTPVRGSGWFRVQGRFDYRTDFLVGDAGEATGTRRVLFQASYSESQKPFTPQLNGWPGESQLSCDVLTGDPIGRQRDDACPLHQAHRDFLAMCPGQQSRSFHGGENDGGRDSHVREIDRS